MGRVKPKYIERLLMLMGWDSQDEFAKAIGVNRDRVNNWINNRSKLDYENLIKIANYCHVTTDYVLGVSDIKEMDTSLRGVEAVTGLSEDSIKYLSNCKELNPEALKVIDSLIGEFSIEWTRIANYVRLASASEFVYKKDGEPSNKYDRQHPLLKEVLSVVGGAENFIPATKGAVINDSPKGTVLLPASDASEHYKEMATKVFSAFLDKYVNEDADRKIKEGE